jgi:hypothetical protein
MNQRSGISLNFDDFLKGGRLMSKGEKLVYFLAAVIGAVVGSQFGGLLGVFGAFAMVAGVGFADMLFALHEQDDDHGGGYPHQTF